MSAYENYKLTSSYFDKTRAPIGIEIIRKELKKNILSLKNQVIIDAGCGTGLYSKALINDVKFIAAVDINKEMVEKAKTRLRNKKNISFHIKKIDSLPFNNNFADAILVNQVLHHLPDNSKLFWLEHRKVFKEFFRVLKSRGCLIINSCSHKQLKQGFWYYHLIPKALNSILDKTINLSTLVEILKSEGFSNINQKIPFNLTLQGNKYFNKNGILDQKWRSGDSIWSLVSEDTLSKIISKISELKEKKSLESLIQEYDKNRLSCGQITFTFARK